MLVSEIEGYVFFSYNLGGNADNLRPINYRTEFFYTLLYLNKVNAYKEK